MIKSTYITQTYRLHPTPEQERYFWKAVKVDNAVYNKAVEWDKNITKETGKHPTQRQLLDNLLTLKKQNEFFSGNRGGYLKRRYFPFFRRQTKGF